jgi:hypothetical protein
LVDGLFIETERAKVVYWLDGKKKKALGFSCTCIDASSYHASLQVACFSFVGNIKSYMRGFELVTSEIIN